MPTNLARAGFIDSYHGSRVNHLTGTAYPAAPATIYLGLYLGQMPKSDGTGGTEVSPATRPTLTLGAAQFDVNGRQYITNAAAITGITLTNTSAGEIVGFGVFSATSGGTPIYIDRFQTAAFQVQIGQTISIPAGGIKVFAEPPTL